MAEMNCYECVFENKESKEMPCRMCRNGHGNDYSFFVSREATELLLEYIIQKAFEEKETK